MYGEHRPYGYAYGGSGGGFRTIGGAENTTGVWDGFVPYVIGSPMAIPNMFTVRMHAQRILRHRFDAIVDAVEPGGSGDMYEGLDDEERAALPEVTRMGFPPRSWFGHRTMGMHAFPVLYGGVRMADPTYFEEFWTEPGYLGHDDAGRRCERDIVQQPCEVVGDHHRPRRPTGSASPSVASPASARGGVDTAWQGADDAPAVPVAVRLSERCPRSTILGADLVVALRRGRRRPARSCVELVDDVAVLRARRPRRRWRQLRPGDAVEIDNRGFLAAQTYHRHQVPTPDFHVWDQFRDPDGDARSTRSARCSLGPLFAAAASGHRADRPLRREDDRGRVRCSTARRCRGRPTGTARRVAGAPRRRHRRPLPALVRRQRAARRRRAAGAPDPHDQLPGRAAPGAARPERLGGAGRSPRRRRTSYEVVDGQVVVPADAAERRRRPAGRDADRRRRRPRATSSQGPRWCCRRRSRSPRARARSCWWSGTSTATATPSKRTIEPAQALTVERRHTFGTVGTHFPTVRVASHRDGDTTTPFARIYNLARARVVVG